MLYLYKYLFNEILSILLNMYLLFKYNYFLAKEIRINSVIFVNVHYKPFIDKEVFRFSTSYFF